MHRQIILFFLLSVFAKQINADAYILPEEQEARLKTLRDFSFDQLLQLEVTLDDVFDVFDGLLKAKKVKLATGLLQNTAIAPAVTTVITAQDIEATGARNLDEALLMVPGLISRPSTLNSPIYNIRGLSSGTGSEVVLMVNGSLFKSLIDGSRDFWNSLPIQNVARIEIVRGPGSALYGADAVAGTINVITKNAQETGGSEAGVRSGSFNTREAWLLHGGSYGKFSLATALQYTQSDEYQGLIEQDLQTQLDKLAGTSASLAPGPNNIGFERINAHVDISYENWRLTGGYYGQPRRGHSILSLNLDPEGYDEVDRYNLDLLYHNPDFASGWDISAKLTYVDWRLFTKAGLFPPGTLGLTPPFGLYPDGVVALSGTAQRQNRLDLSAFYSGMANHIWRFGVGGAYEDLYEVTTKINKGIDPQGNPLPPASPLVDFSDTASSIYPEQIRRSGYAFIQDSWRFINNWELTGGIRYDRYSDFGSTTNPRLALVWQPDRRFSHKLLYGKAFRAPTYRDLYIRNVDFFGSNPDLKSEKSVTWEWASDYHLSNNLHLALNLFHHKVENKITPLSTDLPNVFRPQNLGEVHGRGAEFEMRWKISPKSSLLFNYSHSRAISKGVNVNQDLVGYPRRAYLRFDKLLNNRLFMNAQIYHSPSVKRARHDPRPAVPAYTTVDLTLRYKDTSYGKKWNLAVGVRNLFDADVYHAAAIEIPNDIPRPGRNWFLEARYLF